MPEVIVCKYCGRLEYESKMRWLNGRCECRSCYKSHYEEVYNELYRWNDLDGPRPTSLEKGGKVNVGMSNARIRT